MCIRDSLEVEPPRGGLRGLPQANRGELERQHEHRQHEDHEEESHPLVVGPLLDRAVAGLGALALASARQVQPVAVEKAFVRLSSAPPLLLRLGVGRHRHRQARTRLNK
eukprot:989174-Prorocentrum_minimum.AAC.1